MLKRQKSPQTEHSVAEHSVAEFVRIRAAGERSLPSLTTSATRVLRRDTPSRRGWTLIEMLITISLIGTLSGVAVKMLASLLRSEHHGIEHVSRLSTISRLSRQFRTDVHAASGVKIAPDSNATPWLQLTTQAGEDIQYQLHSAGLLRTEKRPTGPVLKDLLRLRGTHFRCLESTTEPRRLTLIIETAAPYPTEPKQAAAGGRELYVEAIIGRDQRE